MTAFAGSLAEKPKLIWCLCSGPARHMCHKLASISPVSLNKTTLDSHIADAMVEAWSSHKGHLYLVLILPHPPKIPFFSSSFS